MKKLLIAATFGLSILGLWGETVAYANTVDFRLYVRHEDSSVATQRVRKSDWDPAVANIFGGLGWGRKVYLRVRTAAENEAATYLYTASENGRYTMHYLPGYGTINRYYSLYASKCGWLDSTINGRFAP